MTGMAVGVLLGLPISAALCDRLGNRRLNLAMFGLSALILPTVALASGFWTLFLAVMVLGFATSLANQAMNIEADRLAYATGKPLIALSHAVWGLGFLVFSSLGALAIWAGLSPLVQFVWGSLAIFTGLALIVAPFRDSLPRPATGAKVARVAWPDGANLRLLAFGASGLVGEMVLRNWSVIYLRDLFGAADWLAALTQPLFVLAQTSGRFALAGSAARFGVATVARTLTAVTLTGITLMALAGNIPLAMIGCGLIGLGTAATYPLCFSALARMTNRSSGENMAGFSILQNLMWLVTPPLFGFVAQGIDLRVALALMLPLPILAWFHVRQVSSGQMT